MINIGKTNALKVSRLVEFGAYLTDDTAADTEILLPRRYVDENLRPGDEIEVFVYNDSEDRPVATTERPIAQVGEVAVLEVVGTCRYGAFLDWGLPKDLLVPFGEQRARMKMGGHYPVFIYLDDASKRIVASARLGKFLGNLLPSFSPGQEVDAVVYERTEIGFRCAVDSLHQGMLYSDELFRPVSIGQKLKAYVKNVRPDGRIDLSASPDAKHRTRQLADRIAATIETAGGHIAISDASSPESIQAAFECSKKDFKKAVGHLLKTGRVTRDMFGE
ncbi:S1-like domain-containing RNA-binding protein [Paramuribaculum intestinale]|uniref:CvfB family protein n=1 Tax=Paramuribaculum intestinale TaxID=2094151 RepID=UPI0025A9B5A1|nr:S1-like domain-containing RNA-binding protein [Paramuribaculum intestinale]